MKQLNHINLGFYFQIVRIYGDVEKNSYKYIFIEYCNENNL